MSPPRRPVEIEPLGPGDWMEYRTLRLDALLDAPDAFRHRHEDEAGADDAAWQRFLGTRSDGSWEVLVGRLDERAVGIASVGLREGGVMWIGGMWVRPEMRGRGAGRKLLEASIAWGSARSAARARLAVTQDNDLATRLYTGAGFVATGEMEPLRNGSPILVAWMEREL